jgi:hypothetical protein
MDPFIEDQEWEDFHSRFNTAISDALAPDVEPRYIVRVERRVYVEHGLEGTEQVRWPDISVLWSGGEPLPDSGTQTGTSIAPVECLLPGPQERRETYLVIRDVTTMEVVTVIETLSPANKRASSDGREQYLEKREEILRSKTNLVELDLLRGGQRLPVVKMPPGDYFAVVRRGHRRPQRADIFHWTIRDPLPRITIPLKKDDAEAPLDLQQVFTTVYDRARYQLSLNYKADLRTPLNQADAQWMRQLTSSAR